MNKLLKLFVAFMCVFVLISCNKENVNIDDDVDLIEYPIYNIEDYSKMDTYIFSETIDNIKYNYTYYFDNDMCVNSKEELTFKDDNSARNFYNDIVDSEEYIDLKINGNIVAYYNNPEYFIYMMYPKETLIELLNKQEEIDE